MRRGSGASRQAEEDTTMRVMVLVKATADSEAGTLPTTADLEAMGGSTKNS
jgi:hypothetical protein